MTPSHRAWAEQFVAALEARVALYGRIATGREGEDVIIACLRDAIDRHRAMLDAAGSVVKESAPAPAQSLPPPVPAGLRCGSADATGWDNPVFWASGTFNPFAGSKSDRMLASAATCRRLGYEGPARGFEAHAAAAASGRDDVLLVDETVQASLAAILPFVAGPQLGLFE